MSGIIQKRKNINSSLTPLPRLSVLPSADPTAAAATFAVVCSRVEWKEKDKG